MSSKQCARCDKTVYPIEELKCLDKVWHKVCFKCQECGMALSMKNYKGFNKLPYCNAHCPQARATAVADTPEARRLAENTRLQSQVKYHEDFEKQKGKLTAVADDPETLRIKNTSKIISNVAYHGEYERKKQMEQKRTLLPEEETKNGFEGQKPQQMRVHPPTAVITDGNKCSVMMRQNHESTNHIRNSVENNQYEKTAVLHSVEQHNVIAQQHHTPQTNNSISINKDNTPYSSKLQSTVIYTSDHGPVNENPNRKVGSIADYDPVNENYGSIASSYRVDHGTYYGGVPQTQVVANSTPNRRGMTLSFKAMYDYTAQDVDEVSFRDGDLIVNCQPIDEGWMTGTVQRTGQSGMLPSNYVEPYN